MMPKGIPRRLDSFLSYQLAHTGNLESRLLDGLAEDLEVLSAYLTPGPVFTTPGPLTPTLMMASASVTPWKAPAMKGLSSGALQNTTSFAQPRESCSFVYLCCLFYDLAHEAYRIHVDTAFCGAHVDGTADTLGGSQCFRNGTNQVLIALCHALGYQGGVAADEVDANLFGGPVQSLCRWSHNPPASCRPFRQRERSESRRFAYLRWESHILVQSASPVGHQILGNGCDLVGRYSDSILPDLRR